MKRHGRRSKVRRSKLEIGMVTGLKIEERRRFEMKKVLSSVICAIGLLVSANAFAEGVIVTDKIASITTYHETDPKFVTVSVHQSDIKQTAGDAVDWQSCIKEDGYYSVRLDATDPLYKSAQALFMNAAVMGKTVWIHSIYDNANYYGCRIKHVTVKY